MSNDTEITGIEVNPSGNDVILNLSTPNIKAELKGLIKRWKKEAELYLWHDGAEDITATLEKCADDLAIVLSWH